MAYINREQICETCNNDINWCGKEKCPVYKVPTADVAEVKWIPVTERLPKVRRDYLCICVFDESKRQYYDVLMFHPEQNAENGYVTGPHFSNEGMDGLRVTHWMPLPEPPKEGE